MVRIVLPSSVRALTALAIVVLALSTPAGAQELGQLYDLNETVSVEADVRNFIWVEPTARIVIAPLDMTKAGPNGLIVVAWHPTTPLNQQGVPISPATSAQPRLAGTWVYVKRSGRDSDAYLPGHLSELGVLTISEAADVLTLHKNPQEISTYRIDGREHPIVWTRDNVSTRSMVTAMREANRLVLDIKLTFPDGSRTIMAKRVFSLTPDGGLLVETTGALVGSDGSKTDRSGTWLYKRAEAENRDPRTASSSAPPVQPPPAAAAAAPTAPKPPNPQGTDSRGAAQAQIDKQVAAGTTAMTDELRKKSQQALEQARVETLCTQRAYKVSTDPANAAHQQALAACRAENGQPGAGGAATAATQVPAVNGTYVGTYQCAQGATRLKVEIDQRNPPLLTALFTFYPANRIPGTNSDSFSYQLEGRYEPTADTRLTPLKWTSTPPPGYAMVGMVGRFEPQAGAFNGRIEGAGCSTFALSRNPIRVAEFTFAVNNAAAQPPTQRPASPEPATMPREGNTRPPTPATPSTAPRTTTAAPPKALEFETSDVDALSNAVKAGAREVTVRGTIKRVTHIVTEPGVALKEMPGLYFEGDRVVVGPISHGLWVPIDAKFGKNGLAGKRVAIMSHGGSVWDGRVTLGISSADNIRLESSSAAQPSSSAPAPSAGIRSQSAATQPTPTASSTAVTKDPQMNQLPDELRKSVGVDGAVVKSYCETNPSLFNFYECSCFGRRVFDALIQARAETIDDYYNALQTVAKDAACISEPAIKKWLLAHPQLSRLPAATKQSITECATVMFLAQFKLKPLANIDYAQQRLVETVKECSR